MADYNLLENSTAEELDAIVEHYETTEIANVRKELRDEGVDPAPTIAAVKQLVSEALANRKKMR